MIFLGGTLYYISLYRYIHCIVITSTNIQVTNTILDMNTKGR